MARGRGGALALGLAAAGVLALLAGAGLALTGGQPLRVEGLTITGGNPQATFAFGGRTITQLRYADGAPVTLDLRVRNAGRLGVRMVDGRLVLPGTYSLLQNARDAHGRSGVRTRRLGGHEVATIRLPAVFGQCEFVSSRSGSVIDTVSLRYRVLGVVDRTARLTLPRTVRVGSPRDVACPRTSPETRSPG